jgi:protein-S-isoprenylcysteine O-methyltransferase Ste14
MYLGGNLLFLGISLALRLYWMALLFPLMQVLLHRGVILREESYLERKFGSEYVAYKARVRRWL